MATKAAPGHRQPPAAARRPDPRSDVVACAILVVATLVASGWFLVSEQRWAGTWGFALDDSWIYATFARNLADGAGYSFNPGESVGGATGPLYVFLLTLLLSLTHEPIWSAKVLGIACLAGSSVVIYFATRRVVRGSVWIPLLVGLLVGISPSLLWGALSGMEIPVYTLFLSLGILFYTREQWTLAAACWAAVVWLRPDGIFLALLAVAQPRKMDVRARLRVLAPVGLILAGYVLFNLTVGGKPLPNSVYVKTDYGSLATNVLTMIREEAGLWGIVTRRSEFGEHAALLLPFIVAGTVATLRQYPVLGIFTVAFPLVFSLACPSAGIHARYIMPIIPFAMLLAGTGVHYLAHRLPRRRQILVVGAVALGCLLWQANRVVRKGFIYGANVQNINDMQRFLALAAKRRIAPGDTIAVNDVGAMGYFSGCYVVDLVGLTSPKRPMPENLAHYRPKVLIIFPEWFEGFASVDAPTQQPTFYVPDSTVKYVPVAGVGLRWNTICGSDRMFVFAPVPPGAPVSSQLDFAWH